MRDKDAAFLITALIVVIVVVMQLCESNPQKPTVIHTKSVQRYKDTIRLIQTKYATVYQRISESQRPDTIWQQVLRIDTVTGNVDSFIAVQIVRGAECLEVQPFKDSIISTDSANIVALEQAVEDCTKAYNKANNALPTWKRIAYGALIALTGKTLIDN